MAHVVPIQTPRSPRDIVLRLYVTSSYTIEPHGRWGYQRLKPELNWVESEVWVAKTEEPGSHRKAVPIVRTLYIEAVIDERDSPSQTVVPAHFTPSVLLSSCHIPAARLAQSLFLEFLVQRNSELSLDSSLRWCLILLAIDRPISLSLSFLICFFFYQGILYGDYSSTT